MKAMLLRFFKKLKSSIHTILQYYLATPPPRPPKGQQSCYNLNTTQPPPGSGGLPFNLRRSTMGPPTTTTLATRQIYLSKIPQQIQIESIHLERLWILVHHLHLLSPILPFHTPLFFNVSLLPFPHPKKNPHRNHILILLVLLLVCNKHFIDWLAFVQALKTGKRKHVN